MCIKLDIHNANNETFRADTVQVLENEQSLQHMTSYAAVTLAPHTHSSLLSAGVSCGALLERVADRVILPLMTCSVFPSSHP